MKSTPRSATQRRLSFFSEAIVAMARVPEPVPPALIAGIFYFDSAPSMEALKTVVRERLLTMPRFCAKMVCVPSGGVHLVPVEITEVDLEYHVRRVDLEGKEAWTEADLSNFISGLNEKGLDHDRPLWQFTLVDKLVNGRSVLIVVFDHAVADGVAAVASLYKLLDDYQTAPAPSTLAKRVDLPRLSLGAHILAFSWGLVQGFLGPLLPADPKSSLKLAKHLEPSTQKVCTFTAPISLAEIKAVKAKFRGATVNDIILAVATMALRRYYDEAGASVKRVRAICPVNTRDPALDVTTTSLGNSFAPAYFRFPIEAAWDVPRVVWAVKTQVDGLKVSPALAIDGFIASRLLSMLAGWNLHSIATRLILETYGKVTAILSNVPGPESQVSLAGRPVQDLRFMLMAPIGLYVGLFTYNGTATCCICTDAKAEQDPEKIAKHWKPAFEAVKAYADTIDGVQEQPSPGPLVTFVGIAARAVPVLIAARVVAAVAFRGRA
eukprot:CAMPEP_0206035594 /NCGR_PEP_ID=MMETSP1466-20131121/2191_1 /ASSEMBLY_ACC=CAM_ASM_001126 /TAXON_ID=44452 /ORGANISM="Pavlova gyrans, Strain CCMP608" /LENGTH=492 /DNA_ID=CAMNT_0053409987 /DNA_START=32 /DNA_END=1510 /DNA_ORIENTATION=-